MRNNWRKLFGTAALAFVLCLTGLAMSGEAQAQRFTDNGNGTVTDTVTGLMWTKNPNPFGVLSWHDAMIRCSQFHISGIRGWRLPSKDELVALYHAIQGGSPFTGLQSSYYWSSTISAEYSSGAWGVYMYNGSVFTGTKSSAYRVWPVRAGQ